MFTQTIGNIDPLMQQQASSQNSSSSAQSSDQVETNFLDYMKESPMQRMIDAWLKAHNLTEKDLESMSPEKRDAIEKQMADDIKNQIEREAANKTNASSASASASSSSTAATNTTAQSAALSSSMLSVFFGGSGSTDASAALGQKSDKDELDALGL